MNSLRAYIQKEIFEGIRTYRFLIIAAGVLFFAIGDPVLLKLTPWILKSQAGGIDISSLIDLSQKAAMQSFTKSLYQIGSLVITFSLMGIIAGERKEKTFIMPVSMGCDTFGIVVGKMLVYSIPLMVLSVIGTLIAYYYSGILFEQHFSNIEVMLRTGTLFGLYFGFLVSLVIFLGTIFKRPFIVGLLTLVTMYFFMQILSMIKAIKTYLPLNLVKEAQLFTSLPSKDLLISVIGTLVLIIILNITAIERLKRIEL